MTTTDSRAIGDEAGGAGSIGGNKGDGPSSRSALVGALRGDGLQAVAR